MCNKSSTLPWSSTLKNFKNPTKVLSSCFGSSVFSLSSKILCTWCKNADLLYRALSCSRMCISVLQLIKNNKSKNKLSIVFEGGKKKDFIFEQSSHREAFCQLMQYIRNKHSDATEPDCVSVFCGSWNMGKITAFFKAFFKSNWSLKIVQQSFKICKFLLKQLLTAVSFTNLKMGGLSKLLNGFSSQTLKKHLVRSLLSLRFQPVQICTNITCFLKKT